MRTGQTGAAPPEQGAPTAPGSDADVGKLKVSIKMTVSQTPITSEAVAARETAQAALDEARASALVGNIARSTTARFAQMGYEAGSNAGR